MNQFQIVKDVPNKKITVTRLFSSKPENVWKAWTESKLLDQWWAPRPWKAETKHFEFKEGGYWLYAMVGPNQERHWARVDFKKIDKPKSFDIVDAFCDENGNINNEMPVMKWKSEFFAEGEGTKVVVHISFDNEKDINTLLEMGFEEGFASAMTNLDQYFSEGFK